MIKHCLENWPGIKGPKKSWWYKMHLFNSAHHQGPLLYFDLDCVLVRNLDWIHALPCEKLWALRDFKYLQSDGFNQINSSVMWWDTRQFEYLWQQFNIQGIDQVVRKYQGDQDFIHANVPMADRRYLDERKFQSYRWQVCQGGWDFRLRKPNFPGSPDKISAECAVVVFHGYPKPHQVNDEEMVKLWC
jgi:alpha-N-acetylglucosamine transferase